MAQYGKLEYPVTHEELYCNGFEAGVKFIYDKLREEQLKGEQMTDEETAEEYLRVTVCGDNCHDLCEEPCIKAERARKHFLAGLKAGSQLDKVWHDYDAGEDCYEDSHEGRWVKREAGRPKWHKVADGDLPEKGKPCLVYLANDNVIVARLREDNVWTTNGRNAFENVIAWCEVPQYTEE